MEYHYFPPSESIILSGNQPAPGNWHTTPSKCPSTFASAQKSGKKSPSRPIRIFPTTEPKPGNQSHDFLIPARFGTWSGRRHPNAGSVGASARRSDKPDRLPAPRERFAGAVDRCAAATRHPHARPLHVAPADPPALVIAYFDIT